MAPPDRSESPVPHAAQSTNQALREAADRLMDEWSHIPPGSVLRCFSTCVRTALLEGHALTELAAVAERQTRQALELRALGDRRTTPRSRDLRVPRPRRAI